MSFLSSVLDSISKADPAGPGIGRSVPPARTQSSPAAPTGLKRRADGDLENSERKTQRQDLASEKTRIRSTQETSARPAQSKPERKTEDGKSTGELRRPDTKRFERVDTGARVARPTVGSSVSSPRKESKASATRTTPGPDQKKDPRSRTTSADPSLATNGVRLSKSTPATKSRPTSSAVNTNAQPKKGSFKELMARANANQAVGVGKIAHKAPEKLVKLSKRERMALARGKTVRGKDLASIVPTTTSSKDGNNKDSKIQKPSAAKADKYSGTSKPKAATRPVYQGTAKPVNKPSYSGTSKPSSGSNSARNARGGRKVERNEYLATDEEDEGEYGYESGGSYDDSDDFSDMDAGFDEIGYEEEQAERQARQDDIKEQKLLDKLARDKADRNRGRPR